VLPGIFVADGDDQLAGGNTLEKFDKDILRQIILLLWVDASVAPANGTVATDLVMGAGLVGRRGRSIHRRDDRDTSSDCKTLTRMRFALTHMLAPEHEGGRYPIFDRPVIRWMISAKG
jgi:hypothetical protein